MNFEAELQLLKRRVDDLEGAVNVLTGHIRTVHPQIEELRVVTNRRFDATDHHMQRIMQRLDTVNTQVWGLRDDLPSMLRAALNTAGDDKSGA